MNVRLGDQHALHEELLMMHVRFAVRAQTSAGDWVNRRRNGGL